MILGNTMSVVEKNSLLASMVICELGGTKQVALICDVGVSAVNNWLNRGLPRGMKLYLQERFPKLKAWKQAKINGWL